MNIGDNELIREFMNVPISNFPLPYNTSWDWLIPVVEKIERIGYPVTINCYDSCYINNENIETRYIMVNHAGTKFKAVYRAVIEFIKWYNENHSS